MGVRIGEAASGDLGSGLKLDGEAELGELGDEPLGLEFG